MLREEGLSGEPRGRSYSVPSLSAMQCSGGVASTSSGNPEMAVLKHTDVEKTCTSSHSLL